MSRGFTGRHMLLVMLGFFGLVIGVNFTMAWYASSTFGGTIVDNSYVASQKFNGWLQAARAQDALGWTAKLDLDSQRRVGVTMNGPGFRASGSAHHPLGRAPDVPLAFATIGVDRLQSTASLPAGRWHVRVTINRDGREMRLAETLQ